MRPSLVPIFVSRVSHVLSLRLPFWRYRAMFAGAPSFLLDSANDAQPLGRWSFLGGEPFLIVKAKRVQRAAPGRCAARVEITDRRAGAAVPSIERDVDDVFAELRALLAEHRVERTHDDESAPFQSGAVGYIAYGAAHFIEDIPDSGKNELALPDIYLLFVDTTLSHRHRTGASRLAITGRGPTEALARENAERTRGVMLDRIASFEANAPPPWTGPAPNDELPRVPIEATFDEAAYCERVAMAKEHIVRGDAFEVCLTQRLRSTFSGDPWNLYQALRRTNPAPFGSYFDLPEAKILSSSPERFVALDAARVAESRPIKGTRPRGSTPEKDRALADDLATAEKDRAEHTMIVDVVRNDLGRVCRFGTVHVPELRAVERYATVHQLVSTIRGELDDGNDGIDLLTACFPGGSMTGAPKVEAMKIIDRLEPTTRGVYAGAIGYMDFSGPMDFSIVIRTLILDGTHATFNVGGAIVADSDPHAEYEESMDKARALIVALASAKACE